MGSGAAPARFWGIDASDAHYGRRGRSGSFYRLADRALAIGLTTLQAGVGLGLGILQAVVAVQLRLLVLGQLTIGVPPLSVAP